MDNKYHYVVFGSEVEYFRFMFKDAVDKIGVEYICNPIKNGHYNSVMRWIYGIHNNDRINYIVNLPGKKLWYPLYYTKVSDKPICFVFMMGWCNIKYKALFELLRKRYLGCKIVLYLEDVISSRRGRFQFEFIKEFDCVITYDKEDAEKYGFIYYPTFMSKYDMPVDNSNRVDACFWGVEKDRGTIINEVYDLLISNNITCDFFVTRAKNIKLYSKGIRTAKYDKPYTQYLHAVNNSSCIVEIMQKKAVGYSLRTWEALLYGKVLLTNNHSIIDTPYYNPNQIIVFDHPKDIDVKHLQDALRESFVFNSEKISPVLFFKKLDSLL